VLGVLPPLEWAPLWMMSASWVYRGKGRGFLRKVLGWKGGRSQM